MKKVYVSSPFSIGDPAINVRTQIEAGNILIENGFCPFVPLLSFFQHMICPQPYETWLELDLEWVTVCDCILRLPGESKGADREVEKAIEKGIPVFYSIFELFEYYK